MNGDFENIDQLFQDKLLNITPESALSESELWNSVQSQLPKKRNKFIFWWIGVALLLIGVGAVAVYYSNPKETSAVSTQSSDRHSSKTNSVKTSTTQNTKTISADSSTTITTPATSFGSNKNVVEVGSSNSSSHAREKKSKVQENLNFSAMETGFLENILTPFDSPSIGHTESTLPIEEVEYISLLAGDSLEIARGQVEPVFQIKPERNPLQIGIYGIVNTVLLQDRTNVRYSNQLGNGLGISVGKSKSRLYWLAAAEWTNNRYVFNYERHEKIPFTYTDFPVEILMNGGSVIDTIYRDTTVKADYSRIVKHNNSFKAASARIEVGRVFGSSKIRPTAGLGVGIHYIYTQNGRYLMENNEVSLLSEGTLGLKKFTYSPFLKLGLEYQVNNRTAIGLSTRADWYSGGSWLNSSDKSIVVPAAILAVGYKL